MIESGQIFSVASTLQNVRNHMISTGAFPDAEIEAVERSAVSRAYYAVFCYARDLACKRGHARTGKDVHVALWTWYGNHATLVRKKGFGLKTMRCQADYDTDRQWGVDLDNYLEDVSAFRDQIDDAIAVYDKMKQINPTLNI